MLDQQREYVLRTVEERGVRLIRLWFTDVLGNAPRLGRIRRHLIQARHPGLNFAL